MWWIVLLLKLLELSLQPCLMRTETIENQNENNIAAGVRRWRERYISAPGSDFEIARVLSMLSWHLPKPIWASLRLQRRRVVWSLCLFHLDPGFEVLQDAQASMLCSTSISTSALNVVVFWSISYYMTYWITPRSQNKIMKRFQNPKVIKTKSNEIFPRGGGSPRERLKTWDKVWVQRNAKSKCASFMLFCNFWRGLRPSFWRTVHRMHRWMHGSHCIAGIAAAVHWLNN